MPDSIQVFPPGFRVLDANADQVSGAKIYFDDAGTSNDKTTYSDSGLTSALPNPIVCDSGGRPTSDGNTLVNVYVDTSAYKVTIDDASDVELYSVDNQLGALDTSSFGSGGSGTYSRPVTPHTSDYSIVSGDQGDWIQADPTGGTFTLTLPSAVTVGDGFAVSVRHDGTANQVRIASVSSQTFDVPGAAAVGGYALTGMGHAVELVSDGANWIVNEVAAPLIGGNAGNIVVVDILTSPPASPTAGARYMLGASPTGDWSSFSEHDIAEADGQGGWIQYTPPTDCGWQAYDQDSNIHYQFRASAWVAWSNVIAPAADDLSMAILEHQETQNTDGGTATTGSWETRTLNTEVSDPDSIVTLSANAFTPASGNYLVMVEAVFNKTTNSRIRLYNVTQTSVEKNGQSGWTNQTNGDNVSVPLVAYLTANGTDSFRIESNVGATQGTNGWGAATNLAVEVYLTVTLFKLTAIAGPDGAQGAQGPTALTNSTVAGLNALSPSEGQMGYASDGRKNGEGAGVGTGCMAFYDGSAWIAVDTGATLAA